MEELPPITPLNFFQIASSCQALAENQKFPQISLENLKKYKLPSTSNFSDEESFADVAMGWSEEGLEFLFYVHKNFEEAFYPNITKGDSVEIFIDTRNIKTSGFNTKFCHHFFFLPEAIEGHQMGEITHFRTEDAHELSSSSELQVKKVPKKEAYLLHCFIPKTCLVGFDPLQFEHLGFTYRINRPHFKSQHFSVVTDDFQLEEQPSLWGQIKLIK